MTSVEPIETDPVDEVGDNPDSLYSIKTGYIYLGILGCFMSFDLLAWAMSYLVDVSLGVSLGLIDSMGGIYTKALVYLSLIPVYYILYNLVSQYYGECERPDVFMFEWMAIGALLIGIPNVFGYRNLVIILLILGILGFSFIANLSSSPNVVRLFLSFVMVGLYISVVHLHSIGYPLPEWLVYYDEALVKSLKYAFKSIYGGILVGTTGVVLHRILSLRVLRNIEYVRDIEYEPEPYLGIFLSSTIGAYLYILIHFLF